jgi:hypothetical protein
MVPEKGWRRFIYLVFIVPASLYGIFFIYPSSGVSDLLHHLGLVSSQKVPITMEKSAFESQILASCPSSRTGLPPHRLHAQGRRRITPTAACGEPSATGSRPLIKKAGWTNSGNRFVGSRITRTSSAEVCVQLLPPFYDKAFTMKPLNCPKLPQGGVRAILSARNSLRRKRATLRAFTP